ncbi:MAG: hypothetical protein WDN28_23595 [Chthoniobacter sp.]
MPALPPTSPVSAVLLFRVGTIAHAAAASFSSQAADAPRKPNILIVLADDEGWGDLWRKAFDTGKGGIFSMSVADAFEPSPARFATANDGIRKTRTIATANRSVALPNEDSTPCHSFDCHLKFRSL